MTVAAVTIAHCDKQLSTRMSNSIPKAPPVAPGVSRKRPLPQSKTTIPPSSKPPPLKVARTTATSAPHQIRQNAHPQNNTINRPRPPPPPGSYRPPPHGYPMAMGRGRTWAPPPMYPPAPGTSQFYPPPRGVPGYGHPYHPQAYPYPPRGYAYPPRHPHGYAQPRHPYNVPRQAPPSTGSQGRPPPPRYVPPPTNNVQNGRSGGTSVSTTQRNTPTPKPQLPEYSSIETYGKNKLPPFILKEEKEHVKRATDIIASNSLITPSSEEKQNGKKEALKKVFVGEFVGILFGFSKSKYYAETGNELLCIAEVDKETSKKRIFCTTLTHQYVEFPFSLFFFLCDFACFILIF